MKIFQNIINNPTQTQKYGDLNLNKITRKLSNCQPALKLLILSGFKENENNQRLLWSNTTENMTTMKHIHHTLKSMIHTAPITKNDTSRQPQHQTQHDMVQMITNLIMNQSTVKFYMHWIISFRCFFSIYSQSSYMIQ